MAVINPSDLTFSGQEVRTFAEATIEALVQYPTLNDLHTVVPGIVAKKQIAILGHLSKITRKDTGCGNGKLDKIIPMSQKFWNPVDFKIWLSECWTQFRDTFMVYMLNVGNEKPDLTTTDIFDQWLVEEVGIAAGRDATRIAWFGDTAAALATGGGVFSAGVEVLDYSMIDGFWKQIFTIVSASAARRITITKNAGASYAAQTFDSTDTTNKVATNIFLQMTFQADLTLQARPDKVIWSTRSLVNQYILERLANDNVELAYTRLESGIDTIQIMGVTVLINDQWDEVIRADQNNGTKWNLPHRAVMSFKDNLQVGVDSTAATEEFDVWYSKDTETSNIKGLYKMDAKVIQDKLIQAAY